MSKEPQEDEKAVLAALDGIVRMPVSYTHLDVYKRQSLYGQTMSCTPNNYYNLFFCRHLQYYFRKA